jgi:hypothetical protein
VRGWRSPRMEAAAAIQRKTRDGGGAPVIGAGHTARGQMGGLPSALSCRSSRKEREMATGAR